MRPCFTKEKEISQKMSREKVERGETYTPMLGCQHYALPGSLMLPDTWPLCLPKTLIHPRESAGDPQLPDNSTNL